SFTQLTETTSNYYPKTRIMQSSSKARKTQIQTIIESTGWAFGVKWSRVLYIPNQKPEWSSPETKVAMTTYTITDSTSVSVILPLSSHSTSKTLPQKES